LFYLFATKEDGMASLRKEKEHGIRLFAQAVRRWLPKMSDKTKTFFRDGGHVRGAAL
jgi:hypothetical protein